MRAALRGILIAIGIFAGLAIGEIGLRVIGSWKEIDFRCYDKELGNPDRLPAGIFRKDPDLKWSLSPAFSGVATTSDFSVLYKINRLGFRDEEVPIEKPAGEYRVVALGDSFTFGEGVPYGARFVDLPERALPRLNMVDMGVPGYGLEQELVLLERDGLALHPDAVALFINAEDISRTIGLFAPNGKTMLGKSAPVPRSAHTAYLAASSPFYRDKQYWLSLHSQLFSLVRYYVRLVELNSQLRAQDAVIWENLVATAKRRGRSQANWRERGINLVRRMLETCEARHLRLMIINIDPAQNLDFLGAIDSRIDYLDLMPELRRQSQTRQLGFQFDTHFNPDTHRAIGTKLTEFLRSRMAAEANAPWPASR